MEMDPKHPINTTLCEGSQITCPLGHPIAVVKRRITWGTHRSNDPQEVFDWKTNAIILEEDGIRNAVCQCGLAWARRAPEGPWKGLAQLFANERWYPDSPEQEVVMSPVVIATPDFDIRSVSFGPHPSEIGESLGWSRVVVSFPDGARLSVVLGDTRFGLYPIEHSYDASFIELHGDEMPPGSCGVEAGDAEDINRLVREYLTNKTLQRRRDTES